MNSIGEPKIHRKDKKRIKDLLDIFKPDEDGSEIKKMYMENDKLKIKYEEVN